MIGQTISHYRILEKLGEGGMGVVYKAEDIELHRIVALKFLPAEQAVGNARERLLIEARAAASLSHPNICTIHAVDQQHSFIAMEFVDGQTVKEKIEARPLPLTDVVDIAIQAAQGLRVAHAKGVVHRDIKPQNLMVTPEGQVKIMDFGLAQIETRTRITRPGAAAGTPAYMSPEQVRGEKLDHRTDIWSLAVTMYEMVTGQVPFRGDTEHAVTYLIVHQEPEPPTGLRSGVPMELDRVLRKALAKDREERYQSIDDLLVDLRALPTVFSSGRPEVWHTRRAPSRRLLAVIGVSFLLIVAAAVGWRRFTTPTGEPKVKSLAVLPLKSLSRNAEDSALELGMADTIITRVSQLGLLIVRPTSAIRKYAAPDADTLRAAQDLNVDAVLEGTLQRDRDRLRVSVNLLRVADGVSLWSQSFDVQFAGIFDVQDQVSSQVVLKLQGQLSAGQRAKLTKRSTSNPEAYALYTRAMYIRGEAKGGNQVPILKAIEVLRQAVALDPGFALAHAEIASSIATVATFGDHDPALIARAKQEVAIAEQLDPSLAEVHVARGSILRSQYEGFQTEEAIREARLAQKLDPTAGLHLLGYLYAHVGFENKWPALLERALEIDPSNEINKQTYAAYYYLNGRPDEALAVGKRFRRGPGIEYYIAKRMVKELRPLVEEAYGKSPSLIGQHHGNPAFLLALEGRHREAQAAIPDILAQTRRDMRYHHVTYDGACVYALAGNAAEAVKLLRMTSDMGMPNYPLFQRDSLLDPIRKDPEFGRFLAEQKTRWEAMSREFQ
jgi:serine/threonine protein kinase/tetratricopeptide (TPR) repeat protein